MLGTSKLFSQAWILVVAKTGSNGSTGTTEDSSYNILGFIVVFERTNPSNISAAYTIECGLEICMLKMFFFSPLI